MKQLTIILVLLGSSIFGFGAYKGWFMIKKPITIVAHYVEVNCGDNTIDMRVTSVSDSSLRSLVGKTISPEGFFLQNEFSELVKVKSKKRAQDSSVKDFTLVGYWVDGKSKHCFGSICFKVKKFKSEDDKDYTTTK